METAICGAGQEEVNNQMKPVDVQHKRMEAHVIEQLKKHGYTDIEGKTFRELKTKLATIRAMKGVDR